MIGRTLTMAILVALLPLTGCGTTGGDGQNGSSAKANAATKRARAAQKRADACDQETSAIRDTLGDLNDRLTGSISYHAYQTKVGNLSSVFGKEVRQLRSSGGASSPQCLTKVLQPLAAASDAHTAALRTWGDCIADYTCDINNGPEARAIQRSFRTADRMLLRAESNLGKMRNP